MAVETEVKVEVGDDELHEVRNRLHEFGAKSRHARAQESNLLLDFPDGRLKSSGCALRLRSYGQNSLLTFKGKVEPDETFKKRPEFQTRVDDAGAALAILEALGLQISFRYDKFREIRIWEVDRHSVEVCLDETPFGNFVEIEGEPEGIRAAAHRLGWKAERFIRKNYVEMYREAGLGAVAGQSGKA